MLLAALTLSLPVADVAAQDKNTAAKAEIAEENAATQLRWLDSLPKGYTLARTNRQPIFVRVGTQSCTYCRLLEAEIARPDAQKELQRWTLVALDADKSPDAARLLAVGPVPALRLLTPAGKLVVSHDGAMSAAELVKWLKKHHDSVGAGSPADELTETGPPTVIGVVRLLREFQQRDAVLREAAIRRLMPHPDVAAVQVVAAFQEGKLSTRLASLELLKTWKAPVDGLDPWRPKSLSKTKLAKLGNWATGTDFKTLAKQKPKTLTPQELADARAEIDRMLAGSDSEAAAARERLAHHGTLLLPEVYARLKSAETDQARSRLTALRYRLAASPQLVIQWPNGLERLAATNAPVREWAAVEFAKRATPSDEPLLLELFSDPAPLVREIALRALQAVGGDKTNSALLKLLDDPEPNVRAAVLKLLAEKPSPAIADRVASFAAAEKDADLLVHAVRVLRGVKSETPARALIDLLKHKSWRVRSEAAEGLGKIVYARDWLSDEGLTSGQSKSIFRSFADKLFSGKTTGEQKGLSKREVREKLRSQASKALLALLEDEDPFVISRAMTALAEAGESDLVKPLVKAADRHPGLTAGVVKMLGASSFRSHALPDLRRYTKHKSDTVRAAAVAALASGGLSDAVKELTAAFQDGSQTVRVAAANAVHGQLSSQQQSARYSGDPEKMKNEDPEKWLKEIRAGSVLSKDVAGLAGSLEPLLRAKSPDEQLAAALALAQMGQDKLAVPVLLRLAKSPNAPVATLSHALPALLWTERAALFDALAGSVRTNGELVSVVGMFVSISDDRARDRIWKLFQRPLVDAAFASTLQQTLQESYMGSFRYGITEAPLAKRTAIAKQLLPKAKAGPPWQRVAALGMLIHLDKPAAVELADGILDDARQSDDVRLHVYRLILQSLTQAKAQQRAAANLQSDSTAIRNQSLAYLALGEEALLTADSRDAYPNPFDHRPSFGRSDSERLIYPKAPQGLTAAQIAPLLESGDPRTRAVAGYLLVLLKQRSGLGPLFAHWRSKGRDDPVIRRLVYRAIAFLDDPQYLPLLKEIYTQLRQQEPGGAITDFYWTIRTMTGPEMLAFRKRIRLEVGMDNLQRTGMPY